MKQSIKHFRKRTQEELNVLTDLIKNQIKGCEMIILYGSYARGKQVIWDEHMEGNITVSYQSDYDILVVISNSNTRITEYRIQEKVVDIYEKIFSVKLRFTPPEIIVEDIKNVNLALETKRYFFTDIVKEGILLYDSKRFELAKPRKLSFAEIKAISIEEFFIFYPDGVGLLKHGWFDHENQTYKMGSFQLHQACERFYHAICLVFTNYRPRSHDIKKLQAQTKRHSQELLTVFPQNTEFEKHCFDLIRRAYIEARYNKEFVVTKEEFEYMLERVEILKNITNKICTEKIESYDTLIQSEQ